jgi:hypothetical protein
MREQRAAGGATRPSDGAAVSDGVSVSANDIPGPAARDELADKARTVMPAINAKVVRCITFDIFLRTPTRRFKRVYRHSRHR